MTRADHASEITQHLEAASSGNDVSLIIAIAALLISFAGLYLTALRRARIEVERVEQVAELIPNGWASTPSTSEVVIALFISNTGAGGGVLQSLCVSAFSYDGEDPPVWTGASDGTLHVHSGGDSPRHPPFALEAGDGELLHLRSSLRPDGWVPGGEAEPLARRVEGFRRVTLRVEWTYRRASGPFDRLLPGQGTRPVKRHRDLTIEGSHYRDAVIGYWRQHPDAFAGALELATGKAS